jgi:phosphonate transport system substrate-binding protein
MMKLGENKAAVFRWAIGVLCLFLHSVLLSCTQGEEPTKVDFSKREEIGFEETPGTITYAYVPQYFHRVSFERHHPLIEYLKRETGLPIRQVFPDSFDDYIKMCGQGKVDISFANPFIYAKVAQRYGVRAFARIIELDGRPDFRGQIICRSDNEAIQTLDDCRGKRWVAVDASSAGGYLYALGYFYDHGIRKDDFSEITFVPGPGGQQEKVVLAVYSGRYDIGSVREGTLDLVADKIDLSQIRILAHTSYYPGWMYAHRKHLDPNVLSAIKGAFLKIDCMSPEYRPICDAAHFAGIIAARDSDYDSIRELAAKLGINLNE